MSRLCGKISKTRLLTLVYRKTVGSGYLKSGYFSDDQIDLCAWLLHLSN
jgi:hypothetical protein